MSSSVRNILLNLIAAVILAALAYVLSFLFPDMRNEPRMLISGLVAIVVLVIWHYVISPRFKRFTQWLAPKWRYLVIIILLVVIEVLLYLAYADWKTVAFSIAHFGLIAVTAWLLTRYQMKPYSREPSYREEFREDFRYGLENWEYHGEWRTKREDDGCILIVTESRSGGIAKPCLSWKDYVFEFETKIVNGNTSWVIRAADTDNYVMLQCQQNKLRPHFRKDGQFAGTNKWTEPITVPITEPLPLNTWFDVHIEVRGTLVLVTVAVDDREREILNRTLLEPPTAPVSYTMGSVGFRESASECAHFRNVRVKRLF